LRRYHPTRELRRARRLPTRSEGDDLEESAARSCAMGGEDVVKEVKGVESRAGGVGGRTIATICSQFHKLR
jgi:hypothetical protein